VKTVDLTVHQGYKTYLQKRIPKPKQPQQIALEQPARTSQQLLLHVQNTKSESKMYVINNQSLLA
jgi:hypothetical protein